MIYEILDSQTRVYYLRTWDSSFLDWESPKFGGTHHFQKVVSPGTHHFKTLVRTLTNKRCNWELDGQNVGPIVALY